MDATKFASLSVPEKEKIFEGLKPFLKTSARFGVPLVNSLDEYESLSIAEQEVFFETITKPNLALLFTVPTEENSKLKQKTLDSWVISKNSPKKKSLEKESKCNESIFENRNENKSRENYATNSKDVTNTKSIENTGKQHSSISFSEVNSETGKKISTSEKCDAVKKSQQVDSLIASISLDKINKTGNESESESNKKSKISNLPAIKGKSVKSNKQLSKCNKVEAAQMKDDGIDKNPVEVNVIIENELYEASDSPKQLGKRRCKRKAETVVEDTPPQKIQKSVKSPVTESTGEVENTKHFIRKTRNRSKNRSDESLEKNINTDELVSVPSKSDFSSLPYMKETECLTKSTHTKNLKTIQQLKRATRIRGNQTNKSLLKQGTFSMECELSNTQTESHNAQKREKTPKEPVTSLIDNESTGTKSFLNTYADKTKDSENFKTINKNDTTANSVITTKNKSEMKPKTSKMTKTPLKEGNFSPTCTLTTGANTKVEATVEDPIIIRIKKTSETQMSSEYASNVCSNKAKDPKTVASGDSIIVTNYNSKIKSKNDKVSRTLLKGSKISPHCEMSTRSTESCNSQERKIVIENQVELCADDVNFQPDTPSSSCLGANIISEENAISSNKTTELSKRSVRLANIKKTTKIPLKQDKFSPKCELTTVADNKVEVTAKDPIKIHIEETGKTLMSPKRASNVAFNKSKDAENELSVDSDSVTNNCPKIKSEKDKKARLKGCKFPLKSELSRSLTESCNSGESKIMNLTENHAELHIDDANIQPDIPSSSMSANMISEENTISSNKNKNTKSPIKSSRLANKASKLKSKCTSDSSVEDINMCVMKKTKITLDSNETESASQFLKPSKNLSLKNSSKFGIPHENIVSEERNSITARFSPNIPKLHETSEKDMLSACSEKTKNSGTLESCNRIVELESVNKMTFSPVKQSTNLENSIQLAEKPLSKHQINSKQKVTLDDSTESEKQILPSPKQSKISPKSNLSQQYKELNDEIDMYMTMAKNSSICKSQGGSSGLKTTETNESTLLQCTMDKHFQSPKKKSEKHSDKSEITKDNRLIGKAGKRNRKQVHKCASLVNASDTDNVIGSIDETETVPLSESTTNIERKDVKNVGSSPVSIQLQQAEVTRITNIHHKNVEDKIDLGLLKSKSRLTRSKINCKKTPIETPSAEMVCENNSIMDQNDFVDNSLSVEKSKKIDVADQNEEIAHNDQLTNFVPLKRSSSKVGPKINKSEDLKISRRTKRKFSSDLSDETENKISVTAKKEKFPENTLSNAFSDNIKEMSKEQFECQKKDSKLPINRKRKGQNNEVKECVASEINKSEKVNKANLGMTLTSDETNNGKEIGVKNPSENISLETDESKNSLKQNATERGNIMVADTMSKPLPNKRKKLDKNKILKTKRSQLKEKLIDTASEEKEKTSNDMGSSTVHDNIQPVLSPTMQKKYKEYNKLRESCAAIGIDVDELFECQEIKDMINNPDIFTKDGIIFIGPYKLPATEKVVPIVYAHSSKTDLCKSLEKMNIMNMKNTLSS